MGAVITDDWTSSRERFAPGCIGLLMVAICHPSTIIRMFQWIWSIITSIIRWVYRLSHLSASQSYQHIDTPKSTPPTPAFHGRTAKSSEETTLPLLSRHQSVDDDPIAPEGILIPELSGYKPPTPVSCGHISILSGEEMVTIIRHYKVVDEIRTKVKGVSFRNDDGTDRQTILAHCHAGDQLRFKPFEYKGSPAYAVYSEWGQIGNLSADLAEELAEMVAARDHKCLLLGEILNISGGYQGEYFGCNISLTIYEKRY